MSQIAYGTITITDTNDIESIIIEYARNQDPSNAPSSGWSTDRPAWAQGYYIWQRTRTHKVGTDVSEDTYGTAVCITGSTGATGATGQSLSSTKTQYTNVASNVTITTNNHTSYTWTDNVPAYNSNKPAYWARITNTYTNPAKTEYLVYKDQGITDAIKTSNDANTIAGQAKTTANEAKEIAQQASADVTNLQTRTKYFWTNLVAKTGYPVGTYAASGIDGVTFDYENSSTYGYNTLYSNGINLRYNTNVLNRIDSGGMTLYDGEGVLDSNIIAKFSSSGAQIGKSNNSHVEINSTSLQMFATGQTKPYFFISDLRDSDGNITIYDYFLIEPPDNTRATLKYTPIAIVKVEVQGVDVTGDSTIYSQNGNNFTFYDLPNPANNVIITYTTNLGTELYTGYTLGSRPNNSAIGRGSIALGDGVQASGAFSLAEGRLTKALGYCSHAEGSGTTAQGNYSHAEGFGSKASGFSSHAEGESTASGDYSHAEGYNTIASGFSSHAEGESTASGDYSHAEGYNTIASGFYAHSGGEGAEAIGEDSFSHGNNTIANEPATSAFGVGIETNCGAQTVLGRYNYIDPTIIRFTMMGEQEFIYSGGSSRPSGRIYVKADQYDASNVDTLLTYDIVGVEYYCIFDETFYYDLRYGFRNTFNSFEIKLEKDTYNKLYVGLYVTTSDVEEGYDLNYKGISGLKITLLKSTKAFVIGNGTSNGTRSNALTVDWDGNVKAAGEIHGALAKPTISITASTGTLQSATVYRQGNVVQLLVSFRKTSATTSGQEVFEGRINTTALRPKMITTSGTYYGSYALNATISTAGVITVRNADSRSLAAMTYNGNISFTYLVD